jgi:hypothetical protein
MIYSGLSVAVERQAQGAWVDVGLDIIIREAQDRLHLWGMDAVRPALSATVQLANFSYILLIWFHYTKDLHYLRLSSIDNRQAF